MGQNQVFVLFHCHNLSVCSQKENVVPFYPFLLVYLCGGPFYFACLQSKFPSQSLIFFIAAQHTAVSSH